MTITSFSELDLAEPLQRAVADAGYDTPTPIQAQAIPPLLAGRDMLGIAQTGTGKTAAFALPILQRNVVGAQPPTAKRPLALILTPTRELATQIGESFRIYGKHTSLRFTVVFGGVGALPQKRAMQRGVHVLVATPGRLMDLMDQGQIDLSRVETFVLDEADRMLDMGFVRDVKKIIAKLPTKRHSLLFSATMPRDIVDLAHSILVDPVRVEVTPPATTVDRIRQSLLLVEKSDKRDLLVEVLRDESIERVLVFTRTKHGADRVVKHLDRTGEKAAAIHGNKSQGQRERALKGFKEGKVRVLVATDIAARGIDVRDITHVINFDLPNEPESYVHRIGRTARAGRDGIAISFCDVDERAFLMDIEKLIGIEVPITAEHACRSLVPFVRDAVRPHSKRKRGGGGGGEGASGSSGPKARGGRGAGALGGSSSGRRGGGRTKAGGGGTGGGGGRGRRGGPGRRGGSARARSS